MLNVTQGSQDTAAPTEEPPLEENLYSSVGIESGD